MELVKAIKGRILIRLKVGRWGELGKASWNTLTLKTQQERAGWKEKKSQKVRSRQRDYSVHRPAGKVREWFL